jgi:serine/threonine-protein kinase
VSEAAPTAAPESPAPEAEVLPRKFGKYTLLRRLAQGGMAELYLALHRAIAGFERLVVIKRILPELGRDAVFIQMLLQEARIAATFSHPNIVTVFDVGQVDGTYFIAMEHIHGEDLRSIVRAMKPRAVGEFPLEHAVAIAQGVAAGLAYAHERTDYHGHALNVVHRDISPQNILVTFTGDVKVVDFGIAKAGDHRVQEASAEPEPPVESGVVARPEASEHHTRQGQLKGKIPYMSPEQARGDVLDARSDIFSLGIILFELCTGRRLFRGPNELETLKMITDGRYPVPSELNPRISPALQAVIVKALSPEREQRYQSARELQADLEAVARDERIAVSNVALGNWMGFLFEEKLAALKEALAQGKQLADVLAQEEPTQDPDGTGYTIVAAPQGRRGLWALVAALALVAVAAVGLTLRERQRAREDQRIQAQVRTGVITVHSIPEGAHIWLNDAPTAFRTPHELRGLLTGPGVRLRVKLTAEGYDPATQEVPLSAPGAHQTITAALRRTQASSFAVLQVGTTPPGAQVIVDGREVPGRTPLAVTELAPQVEHTVLLRLEDYSDERLTFSAEAGAVEQRAVVLRERPLSAGEAFVDLTTEPPDAHLRVGERDYTGGSPFHVRVPAGRSLELTVNAPDHQRETRSLRPASGQTLALGLVRLARERPHTPTVDHTPGRLTVGASPWCNVTIDGQGRGQTPVVGVSLPPGRHTIVCTNPDRPTQTRRVELAPGQDLRVRIVFP